MIKVVLIDDEPLARNIIMEYLLTYPEITVLAQCNDGFEGMKAIMAHQPDLIFLDIQMPKITGFEMLELLEQKPVVIFTTAYDEYAIKAFESEAIDYLLKPFSKERFDKALQKWLNQRASLPSKPADSMLENIAKHPDEHNRIVVKTGNNIRILPIHEVNYIEAYDDYVKVFTNDGYFLKKKTMSYYETILDSTLFVRVHRSFILNIQQITKIEIMEKDTHIALLKNGSKVPLSKSGYSKLKETLNF